MSTFIVELEADSWKKTGQMDSSGTFVEAPAKATTQG